MEETPKEETKKPKIAWKSFLSWASFAWMALIVFIIDIVTKWVMQLTLKTDGCQRGCH
jgi:lipoprotein signal peptidase